MVERMEVGKKYRGVSAPAGVYVRECLYVLPDKSALLSALSNNPRSQAVIVQEFNFHFWDEVKEPRKTKVRYLGIYENPVNKLDIQPGQYPYQDKIAIPQRMVYYGERYELFDTMEIQYVEGVK